MFTRLKQSLVVWLIKKVQKYGPRKVLISGRVYEISEDVFNPKFYFTSRFMAEHISVTPEDNVLDMGTGSGIQAVTAGHSGAEVIAVDINPEAVRYAYRNVMANALDDSITVQVGDLFSTLDPQHKFSVILFTPPYLEGTPETLLDKALYDPDKDLLIRFFKEAKEYLRPGGYIQMIYSSIAGNGKAISAAEQSGWNHSIIARAKTLTEEFIIYRLTLG
ncbi:MAG: methyltransferase domain-containing protein [Nitrospiraceae bacterium]|nr:MAG: methyltransferase domain-containing protein [Nitrospiraceae bacterium]